MNCLLSLHKIYLVYCGSLYTFFLKYSAIISFIFDTLNINAVKKLLDLMHKIIYSTLFSNLFLNKEIVILDQPSLSKDCTSSSSPYSILDLTVSKAERSRDPKTPLSHIFSKPYLFKSFVAVRSLLWSSS